MMKPSGQFTSIGGQAVIEGVMMRSPRYISVAVRKSNQKIVIKSHSYVSLGVRYPFLRKPVLRGVVTLLESMLQGMDALSYSAHVATDGEGEEEKLSNWAIAFSIITALGLGMGLFVALPHFLTAVVTSLDSVQLTAQSPLFHILDGLLKVAILLTYVYLIAMMKDIHRVFQYHGAEHKSIYAFEAGDDLTVENARKYTTLHPRCGTSFLFFLILMSITVFSIIFPLFHLTQLTSVPLFNHILMIAIKMVLMLPVAGLAYEFIRACAFRMNNPLFRAMIWPGMVLQNLTTREPDDSQLEVALASLRQALKLEKTSGSAGEVEVQELSEVSYLAAQVSEFPEN